jgi:small subunit ribosomal protein S5
MGKAGEVPEAIRKGVEAAKRNIIRIPLVESTIPHDVVTRYAASKVMLRPASPGTGLKAGGGVRPVAEMAGIKDMLAKSYGSSNKVNVVKATFQALGELASIEELARQRDLTPRELGLRRSRRSLEGQESAQ